MIPPTSAAGPPSEPRRILVFRIGSLGDTLVALPSFWALRALYPRADMTLICARARGPNALSAADVVGGAGIFRDYLHYPAGGIRSLSSLGRVAALIPTIRRRRYDLAVYLAPSIRTASQMERDVRFFGLCGIPLVIGARRTDAYPPRVPGAPLPLVTHEADRLLARLAAEGMAVPSPGKGRTDLGLTDAERGEGGARRAALSGDDRRPWIAVGPGSKMPAKVWPEERYGEVVSRLIRDHDVWPVVFGGPEDVPVAERLLRVWGRGASVAGLAIRPSAALLETCRFYLGNDTGTMHLAAAAGIPCVALFTARDYPGKWDPYGDGHVVLRRQVDCEGCALEICITEKMKCLTGIEIEEVVQACRRMF